MRYIDSGDDVGVALSPQLMFNVVPDCDIFNHQNVHFWEMMQPGMDALHFISLTRGFSSALFCCSACSGACGVVVLWRWDLMMPLAGCDPEIHRFCGAVQVPT